MTRIAGALLLAFAGLALADVAVPPVARVTDQTGTLSPEQKVTLEQKLAAFEQAKGSQLAVLIVPTTAPETIEQYGIRVGEAWKLGRKGVDDGLILLVAKDDRAMRIEVGYGLEGAVPDAIARRVIAETITPRFRDGDFYGGIDAGVTQLIGVVHGEPLPTPKRQRPRQASDELQSYLGLGFLIYAIAHWLGRRIGEVPSSLVAGGAFGGLLWMFGVIAGIAAIGGALLFVFTLLAQLGKFGHGGGGWSTGGRGFRSGGFGGGGFSGGGGGFGGGGASGRW